MHPDDATPPFRPETRRRHAVDAVVCVLVVGVILLLAGGASVRRAAEREDAPLRRDVLAAVGKPAAGVAGALPLAGAVRRATAFLAPEDDLGGGPGFALAAQQAVPATAVPPVGTDAFDPRELGMEPPARGALRRLLVTGDSMAMPLDAALARRFGASAGVRTVRDPHLGTGISKSGLVD